MFWAGAGKLEVVTDAAKRRLGVANGGVRGGGAVAHIWCGKFDQGTAAAEHGSDTAGVSELRTEMWWGRPWITVAPVDRSGCPAKLDKSGHRRETA